MSKSKLPFRGKTSFAFHKTKPRKINSSRSPFQFSAEEFTREFGPQYKTIDVRIGDQKMILDIVQGIWIPDKIPSKPEDIATLEQRKRELEEDNNMLRAKIDILLEILAQVTAEEHLHDIQ